ncbi:MAG: right-handed parallel beta-helix repeat-containing protein [Actinomycetota bacterium]|nr:right-handed parallel beta-helix repeat-containing protein [Actinomycetota bacterium]
MRRDVAKTTVVTALAMLASMAFALPAQAGHLSCGQVITEDTTLDADLGPCPANGLIIEADGVKLDLNGYTVFGTPDVGDGAGILVRGSREVKVTNGTVTQFDGGVVIEGGGANNVTGVVARDNIGHSEGHPPAPGTRYGEGIAVEGSSDNRIADNVVVNNGPFAGIGLYERPDTDHPFPAAPVERNAVMNNVVEDNQFCRVNRQTGARFCDNIGIRLEPGVGPGNAVMNNEIRRNGLDGLSLFGDADDNAIMRNVVEGNGFWGAVPGDGIRVFGSRNQVHQNRSFANRAAGISVGRRTGFPLGTLPNSPTGNPRGQFNDIIRNQTGQNQVFDLWDGNPNCDQNTWRRNTFQTANQRCTTL